MKKILAMTISLMIIISTGVGCGNSVQVGTSDDVVKTTTEQTKTIDKSSKPTYKDGTYEAETESDGEGYRAKGKMIVKDGKITEISWDIIDRNNRVFDETYEEVFSNPLYKQQCRYDLKGAKLYGPKLIETQDNSEVDAISGATWANNKFDELITKLMEKMNG